MRERTDDCGHCDDCEHNRDCEDSELLIQLPTICNECGDRNGGHTTDCPVSGWLRKIGYYKPRG